MITVPMRSKRRNSGSARCLANGRSAGDMAKVTMAETEHCGVCERPCTYDFGFGGRLLCTDCSEDLRSYCESFGVSVYDHERVQAWLRLVSVTNPAEEKG